MSAILRRLPPFSRGRGVGGGGGEGYFANNKRGTFTTKHLAFFATSFGGTLCGGTGQKSGRVHYETAFYVNVNGSITYRTLKGMAFAFFLFLLALAQYGHTDVFQITEIANH